MRIFPIVFAALLLCSFAYAAKAPQEQVIAVTATEAPALVEVRGGLDFPYFVPDVENRANVTIGLALSRMSLSTIASGNLTVYVLVQPKRNDSLLYFGGNPGAKSYYLTLNCTIIDGSCASGSVTERTIGVYFKSSSALALKDDGVVLHASVGPLISEQLNVSELALNQTAYEQVGDLQARIMQAATGIFGLVGQAANATSGVLSDISITVTTNNSSSYSGSASPTAAVAPTDPLLVAAAQAAADARKSILEGDYERARALSNQSESLLAQYAQKQKQASESQKPIDVSPAIGMVFGSLAKPEVAVALLVACAIAFFAWRYTRGKGRTRGGRVSKGSGGFLDFD